MTAIAAARSLLVAMLGFVLGLLIAMLVLPMAVGAAPPKPAPPSTGGASRTLSVVVYGDDPCPAASGDEIVVCAREPESERYRLPKRFRGRKAAAAPAGNAWGNAVQQADAASRAAAGVPNSCSAIGSAGQSGCFLQFQQQAAAERKAAKAAKADQNQQDPQDQP